MVDKLDDVWTVRDFPVLVEVARRVDSGDTHPALRDVAEALGMEREIVALAAAALKRRGLVDTMDSLGGPLNFKSLSGHAYLLTGLHPSADDDVSAFVEALRRAADRTDDPDERSRLRRLADGALGVSTDVLGAVLAAVATKATGL